MPSRALPLLVLLPALLAACGGGPTADRASSVQETRTVVHAAGSTEVPVASERIVTTTDQNALLPLLELGVEEVVASVGGVGPTGEPIFRRTEGFDTTGVAHLGACCEVDVEAVAAQRPDLVVGYEFNEDVYDQLSAIAPTVLVQIFDRPLTEALLEFGDLAGDRAQAEAQLARYEARVASLRERLGDRLDTLSVSVITPGDPGTFFRGDDGQAVGTVMADVAPLRPAAQTGPVSDDAVSVERLSDVDADVVLLLDFTGEERAGGDASITTAPTWRQLRAVQAGQAHVVDATTTVGAAWARMGAFLDVLERHLLTARDDVVVEQG